MKVCIANLLTLLNGRYFPQEKGWEVTQKVVHIISPEYPRAVDGYTTPDLSNELRNKGRNLHMPSVKEFLAKDLETIKGRCKAITGELNSDQRNELSTLLKVWIQSDESIKDDEIVFTDPEVMKKDVLSTSFDCETCFAKFLLLLARRNDNELEAKPNIKDFDPLLTRAKKIIGEDSSIEPSKLKTIRDATFNDVFKEVHLERSLSSKKPNDLRLYHLAIDEASFDYSKLVRFLRINISRYVFSRAKREEYSGEEAEMLGADAIEAIRNSGIEPDDLGDIMLYSFLESVLKAPKIMTNYELNKGGSGKSNGIYLLKRRDRAGNIFYQLVFGVSALENGLNDGIEKAVRSLK